MVIANAFILIDTTTTILNFDIGVKQGGGDCQYSGPVMRANQKPEKSDVLQ